MNDERLGIVHLPHGGRTVPLRFTWERIDALGRNGVTERLGKAESGEAGGLNALAELLDAASGGELPVALIMANPPTFSAAFTAALEAWVLALHGPARSSESRPENPLNRLRTWSSTLFRRLPGRD